MHESTYFSYDGKKARGKPKKRPTNQSSAKTQKKIATRLHGSSVTLPKHTRAFISDVQTNGQADLAGLNQDICHITAVDKMKETMAEAISQRKTLSKKNKRKFMEAVEETLSSDEESDREEIRKKAKIVLDTNTSEQETVEFADEILSRVNRSSRNLRPDHKRPNRGIGNSKDPFILGKAEESRSKGISDGWNDTRKALGMKIDEPKTKTVSGCTLYKSSSVDPTPQNSYSTITGTFSL
jgi:hypothetical protein